MSAIGRSRAEANADAAETPQIIDKSGPRAGNALALVHGETPMDRPLDPDVTLRQRRRRLALGGTAGSLAIAGYLWLPGLVSPSLSRDRIRTSVVERGAVDCPVARSSPPLLLFEERHP